MSVRKGVADSLIGQQRALSKAERLNIGWADKAVNAYKKYALNNKYLMGSEVRDWAYKAGIVPVADNNNAWGSIAVKAVKAGYIDYHGYSQSPSALGHARLARVYVSKIYRRKIK